MENPNRQVTHEEFLADPARCLKLALAGPIDVMKDGVRVGTLSRPILGFCGCDEKNPR